MDRITFLNDLIGCPYEKNAKGPDKFDCWHLAVYVQLTMFNKVAPVIEIPEEAGWLWMIQQFSMHPELVNWQEIEQPLNGLITAPDGAIVLMARNKHPAHCGVYFEKERSVLHADETDGVVFQDIPTLTMNSWAKLRFYVPK